MTFAGLPSQLEPLRAYSHFVLWKFETRGEKPTKVPYNPNGWRASVTDRNTWSDCSTVETAYANGGYDGIGFVLTDEDPFFCIDFDHTEDSAEFERQKQVLDFMNTYAEYSPSGTGLHLWGIGKVAKGRRRSNIEVYSSGRFMTVTGNVYGEPKPIADLQSQLTALWEQMAPSVARSEIVADAEQTATDDEIYNRAANAKNGEKFVRLWNGDGSAVDGSDKSGSAVDQALVNVLAFYTQNLAQIERLWLASPHGRRQKTQGRPDYRHSTISRALTNGPGLPTEGVRDAVRAKLDAFRASLDPMASRAPGELLRIVAASALSDYPPPREWQVDDIIPTGNVTLLYGDGGTGKSLLSLQLAVSTATGRTWLGKAVKHGPALYLSAEDDTNELNRRILAVCRSEGFRHTDITALEICSLAGEDALMSAPVSAGSAMKPTVLYGQIERHISAKRPALVVLDTLADLFGGNENDRAQARQFIGQLRHFCVAYGTTIVVLAHPSLSGMNSGSGASGSTAWNNSVRSRIYFARVTGDNGTEYDPDIRRLVVMKSNYGRVGAEIHVRWQDGAFIKVGETDNTHAAVAKAEQEADELFLSLLATYAAQGRFVTDKHCATYAPKVFSSDPSAGSFKKESLKRAMDRLFAQGRIRLETHGFKSRERTRIALNAGTSNPLPTP